MLAPAHARREIERWTRIGVLVVLATFGLAFAWSGLAPLSSAVVAPGLLKVDSHRKRVQHQDGGVVKEILVRDGQRVRAGDVLVRLDETRAGASHGVLMSARDADIALHARLIAERDDLPQIPFPGDLLARGDDPKVKELIKSQHIALKARRTAIAGQLDIIERQISHVRSQVKGLAAQQEAKEFQLASMKEEMNGFASLLAQGMIEKTKVRSLERDIARVEGERSDHIADIAAARATIAAKELEKFQIRKQFQEEVSRELQRVQKDINDHLERINATRHVLANTDIRAPVDGTVVDLKVHTVGGVISPGDVLLEIVPADDRLVVEAKVRPDDIDRVRPGLPTGVKFVAFDQRSLPELNGAVSYVSADIIEDARLGQSYFLIRLEIPEAELRRLDGLTLQPGMLADVFVRTGERTFLGYLLDPIVRSFDRAWRER